ncbi:DUF397 domain-containing protein [Streptosporangium canum]|uniref:DUF397 domain-containing protein n=1 Tax=Streptosporangium canum TaxID=324952 RepID=UPI0037A0E366
MLSERWCTASESGSCVEVAWRGGCVLVRNTKDRKGAVLAFTPVEWQAFLEGVERRLFDLPELQAEPPRV